MKVAVLGLWHLGSVTAACTAKIGHLVTGWDPNPEVVSKLQNAILPVAEPGLSELVAEQAKAGRLHFVADRKAAVTNAQIVWVTFDTPVDDQDRADVEYVLNQVRQTFGDLATDSVVLLSSQMPVGSAAKLKHDYRMQFPQRQVHFACLPENLRLGKAIDYMMKPDRFVVGCDSEAARHHLESLLNGFHAPVEWMSVAAAEVTKHAINAFLATSVVFANELAQVCEATGTDAKEVERGLKSEQRIGRFAYVSAGGAFAGGTLARDIRFLQELGSQHHRRLPLLDSVSISNDLHKGWPSQVLERQLGNLRGKKIAVLGLTYKPGTDTLRRSSAVELCRSLSEKGAVVQAFDPAVKHKPAEYPFLECRPTVAEAVAGADAVAIMTKWPEFKELGLKDLGGSKSQAAFVVVDPDGFCETLRQETRADQTKKTAYFAIGRSFGGEATT